MKRIILITAMICSFGFGFAQQNSITVPQKVVDKFEALYWKMENVVWDKKGELYEAKFSTSMNELSVRLDENGKLVETEVAQPLSVIPGNIRLFILTGYRGVTLGEASRITTADGTVTYRAEAGRTDLFFDRNGNYLRSERRRADREAEKGISSARD